jgi:hypothetical protein
MARRATPRPLGRGNPQAQSAYERRIAAYQAAHPGATRAQARGHAPKIIAGLEVREHVSRRARELREDLTTYQRGAIRKWAAGQAARLEKPGANRERLAKAIGDDMTEKTIKRGYDAFRAMADELRRMGRARNRQGKVLILAGRARNIAVMEDIADEWDIDLEWLFYGSA